jgi:hypothetical protein
MVTVELFALGRFKDGSPVGTMILPDEQRLQGAPGRYSSGTSKDICVRNHDVFHAP